MELSIKTTWGQSEAFLRIVELTHKYHSIKESPPDTLTSTSEQRSLVELFEGDPELHRRQYRRFPMRLPAALQTDRGTSHGIVLNLSGNGVFIASKLLTPKNSLIQVKAGQPGELEYLFVCKVRHLRRNVHFFGIGCEFSAPPQEIRHQAIPSRPTITQPEQARLRPYIPYALPVLDKGESLCSVSTV